MQGKLPVKKLHPDAKLPTRNKLTDAGLDLYTVKGVTLTIGNRVRLSLGIAMAIPVDHVGLILDRSGMGNKGVRTLAGVIDAGYRGEVQVILGYVAAEQLDDGSAIADDVEIKVGDKIAQMVIVPVTMLDPEWNDDLDETDRGMNGFGSSGR